MATFGILHLTDLHYGLKQQEILIPNIQADFFKDLQRLHQRSGPWDIILFSGDLVQSGQDEQFQQMQKLLDELWHHLKELGSPNPILFAVPGNHDLARPDAKLSAVRVLKTLATEEEDAEIWEDILRSNPADQYRQVLDKAFNAYSRWWEECPYSAKKHPQATYYEGTLPGDFSAVLEKEGVRLGIVGLNTTFLQLTAGDYEGKLAVHLRQFHQACRNNGTRWFDNNIDACLLMTHQPPDWLAEENRKAVFDAELDLPGRFVAHFCGHMHIPDTQTRSSGWASARRLIRGGSLFGLETSSDGKKTERIHAYASCRIELTDGTATGNIRLWPRVAQHRIAGHLEFDRDMTFTLDRDKDDGGTLRQEFQRLRKPPLPSISSGNNPVLLQNHISVAMQPISSKQETIVSGKEEVRDNLLRLNLVRALLKSVPLAGQVADQIIFETAKGEADAQSITRLKEQLDAIQQQLQGHDTDLGDLLQQFELIDTQNQQIREALLALTLYLRDQAAPYTAQVVERAAQKVLSPEQGNVVGASLTMTSRQMEFDRFSLSQAMQKWLSSDQLKIILGDIPMANDNVASGSKVSMVNELLTWAETIEGPGLQETVHTIQRRYPRFSPNPL